ncbi:uncharacterized protein MYCFIDRAFT_111312, partial [Pseudocercospora fijiensis CIRAD86]
NESQRALALVKEHLPKMSPLNAILKLDIGLESGPLYLDARSEPVLTSSHDEEPACSVKIKPEYIKQFVEGKLEPRYGLFKDGFFDETTLPKGDIKTAVKFADYLCPVDRTNLPSAPSSEKLPKPTQDIEQALSDVKKWGYGLVSNALTPDEISTLRSALQQQAAGEINAGVSKHDGGPKASRLWHATGPNRMSEGERPVILMFFMRSFVRQQENNFLSIRPEVEAGMSDKVRRMLGFVTNGAFGGVEGEVREGIFVRRLENAVGMFR